MKCQQFYLFILNYLNYPNCIRFVLSEIHAKEFISKNLITIYIIFRYFKKLRNINLYLFSVFIRFKL